VKIVVHDVKEIEIIGNIVTMEDYSEIKRAIDESLEAGISNLHIRMNSASRISSSIIGYLIKIFTVNSVEIFITVTDETLYRLLENLGLAGTLNIKLER